MDIGAIFDPYLDQTLQLRKAAGKIFKFREANQVEILGIGKFWKILRKFCNCLIFLYCYLQQTLSLESLYFLNFLAINNLQLF